MQKITLGEMRAAGVRGLLIYCADLMPNARFSDLGSRNVAGQLQRRSYQAEHEWAPGTATKHWIAHLNAKLPSAHRRPAGAQSQRRARVQFSSQSYITAGNWNGAALTVL